MFTSCMPLAVRRGSPCGRSRRPWGYGPRRCTGISKARGLAAMRESGEIESNAALRSAWDHATAELKRALGARGGVPPDGDDPDPPRYRCEEEGTCDRGHGGAQVQLAEQGERGVGRHQRQGQHEGENDREGAAEDDLPDRKSTRLNSSHSQISYAVFCLKKKKKTEP